MTICVASPTKSSMLKISSEYGIVGSVWPNSARQKPSENISIWHGIRNSLLKGLNVMKKNRRQATHLFNYGETIRKQASKKFSIRGNRKHFTWPIIDGWKAAKYAVASSVRRRIAMQKCSIFFRGPWQRMKLGQLSIAFSMTKPEALR